MFGRLDFINQMLETLIKAEGIDAQHTAILTSCALSIMRHPPPPARQTERGRAEGYTCAVKDRLWMLGSCLPTLI